MALVAKPRKGPSHGNDVVIRMGREYDDPLPCDRMVHERVATAAWVSRRGSGMRRRRMDAVHWAVEVACVGQGVRTATDASILASGMVISSWGGAHSGRASCQAWVDGRR